MKNFFNFSDSKQSKPQPTLTGSLSDMNKGDSRFIDNIHRDCSGLIRRRLLDLGFVPGTQVTKLGEGLFSGPSRYQIRGNIIALRSEQSALILTRAN